MTNKTNDLLIEIHTEELPPKAIIKLVESFAQQIKERLQKVELKFADVVFYATPRRLAVLIKDLVEKQSDQMIERKGPAMNAAFDANGNPTPACVGFARSCGIKPEELIKIKTEQGEWVGFRQAVAGKQIKELLPDMIEQVLFALPMAKRMRWGSGDTQFVRPVHSIILLYGDQVIDAVIMNIKTGRTTHGHRFQAPETFPIPTAATYASLLKTEGHVIADIFERREKIRKDAADIVKKTMGDKGNVYISSDELLDEVTGLVEWPVALCGQFDTEFLNVPEEVLISAMQDHQRYFPVLDKQHKLLPYFVTISNIESHDPKRVIHGNERVLRARLSDAAFFFETDKKENLESRLPLLKNIVYQAKLGTLHDKAERLSKLSVFIAEKLKINLEQAKRAGLLAKTDLVSNMVGEFPELQGIMGYYYAKHENEPSDVAIAMKEQYMPRFSGDALPSNALGQVLAIADRIDVLVGAFGINQIPTGDKDPYGLRRAALGILRILIEKKIHLDLKQVLDCAVGNYTVKLENKDAIAQILKFLQERLRSYYVDQDISADVFAAVAANEIIDPLDAHKRMLAVQAFKKLTEAETLSIANKRVSNILAKYEDKIDAENIDPVFFEGQAEKILAQQVDAKNKAVAKLYESGKYDEVLLQLAELRKPIDDFFDQVMVMTDDKKRRENRLLLLKKLRALFLQVADIALLQ